VYSLPERSPRALLVALAPKKANQTLTRVLDIIGKREVGGQGFGLARCQRDLAPIDFGREISEETEAQLPAHRGFKNATTCHL
jgi:hypothetical protein